MPVGHFQTYSVVATVAMTKSLPQHVRYAVVDSNPDLAPIMTSIAKLYEITERHLCENARGRTILKIGNAIRKTIHKLMVLVIQLNLVHCATRLCHHTHTCAKRPARIERGAPLIGRHGRVSGLFRDLIHVERKENKERMD